jgi:hypothetical protein
MKKLTKMFRLLRLSKLFIELQSNCTVKNLFYFKIFNKLTT